MNGTEVLIGSIAWMLIGLVTVGAMLVQRLPRLWLGLHVMLVAVCAASIATAVTHWRSAR